MRTAIADTELLVAFLYTRDEHHERAVEEMKQVAPPLLTCESVLTEASYLVGEQGVPRGTVARLVSRGVVRVAFEAQREIARIEQLLDQYADLPMDWADACVVRMSELVPRADVLTVDGEFRIYRRNRTDLIPARLPPNR